jgi:flagellar motor switch/type III secretory pathway protein FliN
MATAQQLGPSARAVAGETSPAAEAEGAGRARALVPSPPSLDEDEATTFGGPVARLPVELDVSVPVREFRVRDLLAMAPGRVIESHWGHGKDVPLAAGEVQLAQSEFEVVETLLAVRITRLA